MSHVTPKIYSCRMSILRNTPYRVTYSHVTRLRNSHVALSNASRAIFFLPLLWEFKPRTYLTPIASLGVIFAHPLTAPSPYSRTELSFYMSAHQV